MDYKSYYLKSRDTYNKHKLDIKSFYRNPVRIIPKNIFTNETIEDLEKMSNDLKIEFDSGKNDMGNIHGINNIFKYKKPIESVCRDLVPYLEENMFGCYLYVDKIYIYRTKEVEIREDSYLWHHDNNPNEIVKIILYLNNVSINNSPFEYLVDNSNRGILAKCTRLGPNNWEPAPNNGRLEEEVNRLLKTNNFRSKKIIGEKFTTFAFSNNTIHRANPIIKGYRDVLNIRVRPTINKPPQFYSPKWTTSYETSGAVNPDPTKNWELQITEYIKLNNKLKTKLKALLSKIKQFLN